MSELERVYQQLLSRAPENKMEPRMDPMFRAMEILGEPQKACPVVHITGTNGKTSTARMIESLLQAHDLRTGRYSSPHLVSVTERISIDGEPVDDETFVRIWDEIAPYLDLVDSELQANGENRLTYFEAVTILGFAIFADAPNPEAAELFLDFIVSKKGQELAVEQSYLPVRDDAGSPEGAPSMADITLFDQDLDEIAASKDAAVTAFNEAVR